MLYVDMTCDTENEEIKQAYLDFVENVEPELAKIGDLLNRKLAESPYADQLNSEEYKVLLRDTRMDLALFREVGAKPLMALAPRHDSWQSIMLGANAWTVVYNVHR